MPGLVMAGPALARGVRTQFLDTYKSRYKAGYGTLSNFCNLSVPSDKLQELYVYPETAPYPVRQPRGNAIESGTFKFRGFEVVNLAFGRAVEWHTDDEEDDQTGGSLLRQAKTLGGNFASLDERIIFQLLSGQADPDLLPSVPNAPDGAALFSTTDGGGNARFGITDGNLLTGTGVANATAIQTDFLNVLEQMGQFKDTESQPLFPVEMLTGFTIICPMALYSLFLETFQQQLRFQSVTTNAAGAPGAGTGVVGVAAAAPTNLIGDMQIGQSRSRLDITLYPSQRITGSDWYVACNTLDHKALFIQKRKELEIWNKLPANSDDARSNQINGVYMRCRKGGGIALPYNMAKVNN